MRRVARLADHVDVQCGAETMHGVRCSNPAAYHVIGKVGPDGYLCGTHERVSAREHEQLREGSDA